jgi:hypothetical protein
MDTMNRFVDKNWWWIQGAHDLRDGVLEQLSDAELAFSPGGDNMPFGELFRQMGEVEYSYIQGLKTLTQHWDYHNTEPGLGDSVGRMQAWLHELDAELRAVAEGFSDDDLAKVVKRGSGFEMPIEMALDVYIQACLIFLGKAVVYLKAMNKPLPDAVKDWIW